MTGPTLARSSASPPTEVKNMRGFFGVATLVPVVLLPYLLLKSSRETAPEPPSQAARAARLATAVRALDLVPGHTAFLRTDTVLGGVTWIEFDPSLLTAETGMSSPQAAATAFVQRYAAAFDLDPTLGELELLRATQHDQSTHFRYGQRHQGYQVLDGQLLVHVGAVGNGFAVRSANGWLFPEIRGGFARSLGNEGARRAAVTRPAPS